MQGQNKFLCVLFLNIYFFALFEKVAGKKRTFFLYSLFCRNLNNVLNFNEILNVVFFYKNFLKE